jgi:hypothetical protein
MKKLPFLNDNQKQQKARKKRSAFHAPFAVYLLVQ